MKKLSLLFLGLLMTAGAMAQDAAEEEVKLGWSRDGVVSLLFSQSAFNAEWSNLNGGTGNITGNANLVYNFNYRAEDYTWDNRLSFDYGITKIDGDEFARKTNDRLEFNSLYGKQIKESNWFYSAFLNFRTQAFKGYIFFEDPVTGEPTREEFSSFFSPAYLQVGPGLLWKKSDNLKVNIAPATARFIFVDSDFTSTPGYVDGDYFGVDAGEGTRFELGASLSGYAKFDVMENISMENILNLYSNYLEDPQNVDVDYTMNLVMKINEYINSTFTFQAVYDDNAIQGFQIREVLGVGVGYKF